MIHTVYNTGCMNRHTPESSELAMCCVALHFVQTFRVHSHRSLAEPENGFIHVCIKEQEHTKKQRNARFYVLYCSEHHNLWQYSHNILVHYLLREWTCFLYVSSIRRIGVAEFMLNIKARSASWRQQHVEIIWSVCPAMCVCVWVCVCTDADILSSRRFPSPVNGQRRQRRRLRWRRAPMC